MNIAFDHQTFTWQTYGGISRYFYVLSQALIDLKHNINIYAGIYRNKYIKDLPQKAVHGIPINDYPRTGRFMNILNGYYSNIKINQYVPDIVHETYYSTRSFNNSNIPRIVTVYDMIHEKYKEDLSFWDNTTKHKRISLERANHIISISHNTKKDLIELFSIDPKKISVVHLGVDSDFFAQSSTQFTTICPPPYLLYVGGRNSYKNFSTFLRAYSLSPKLQSDFRVVCFGGGVFTRMEKDIMSQLGLNESQVKHVSGTDEILRHLYQNAEVLVYPSLYEGFGLPPLEAMASNCPVISSQSSSLPEVINNAGYYFDAKKPESLKNAIENVVYSETIKTELVELGKENIKNFSWHKCAIETLNIYKQEIEKNDE